MRTGRYFLLFFCVVMGLGLVAWRAKVRAETARAIARVEARARGASLDLQFSQASSAAEVLGALARQARGGFTNFQKVATELLTAHPGLASLELQPGGVVSDIVPRAGHERTLGFNVLKDAGQRAGANETIARRVLSVTGPVTLDHGEQGIVARVPVFQRTSDGRDTFWGFVAVSVRLQEAMRKAQVDDLMRQGYDFAFFALVPGQQKAAAIASHGLSSLQDTVQQSVRARNLEFRLALKPRDGWINKTKVAIESLAVLLISAMVALSVNLLESRRAVEAELTEATLRLARQTAERDLAQADGHGAKERMTTTQAQLKQAQLALQQAESKVEQFQARLDASDRERDETALAHQGELKEAQATITQLQTRLNAAAQAVKDEASAAQERLLQNQTAMAELQNRMDTATRSTRETAEASAARVAQLQQSNRELKARLLVAERAEARVTELNGLLEKAQEELRHRPEASTGRAGTAAAKSSEPISSEGRVKGDKTGSIPGEQSTPGSTEVSTSGSAQSPSSNDANSPSLQGAEAPVVIAPSAEPSITHKAAKPAKRKNARQDDQLHLFGNETSAVPATNQGAAAPETRVHESRDPRIPAIEITTPAETLASDRPKTASGHGGSAPKSRPTSAPETAGAEVQPTADKVPPEPSRRPPPAPRVDLAQLRTAVSQILPLLAERDPGAKDCLSDNRRTFRSVFTPEAYVEFEQLVKDGDFDAALEQLKKVARKHGICA
jgi:sensor domain CHASE-containing protein